MKHTKLIASGTLMVCAFLTLIAGINAAPNPKWAPEQANNLTFPLLRSGSTTVYTGPAPSFSNTIIVFAGVASDASHLRLNDVWTLTNANGLGTTPTWRQLSPTPGPTPHVRSNHTAVYDAVSNRMIIYGGCGEINHSLSCGTQLADDVWVLSNADGTPGTTPTWRQLPTTAGLGGPTCVPGADTPGCPPQREAHQAVYDPNTFSMIVWGGHHGENNSNCLSDIYSDVWVLHGLDGLNPYWRQLFPSDGPMPPALHLSSAVYDSGNHIMIVFAGFSGTTPPCKSHQTNAVWALSNANDNGSPAVWTPVVAQGPSPSPAPSPAPPDRGGSTAVYSGPPSNTMTIFGGAHRERLGTVPFGDTWVLSNANGQDPGTPTWTPLNIPGPVASSRHNNAVIDTTNHLMIMAGGGSGAAGPEGTDGSYDGPLWGTWVLSLSQ